MLLAQEDTHIGVIILTGAGPDAFCSGGDQSVRGEGGYDDGSEEVPRLSVLDLQVKIHTHIYKNTHIIHPFTSSSIFLPLYSFSLSLTHSFTLKHTHTHTHTHTGPNAPVPQARHCHGGWVCCRRRTHLAHGV
jgi:hypothetical protein